MLITVMKSKIAYATVTQKELLYVGSITIDSYLMEQVNLIANEQVQIVNLNNGQRLSTYVISGEHHSGIIGFNGPAARCVECGDPIFIIAYAQIDPALERLEPRVVHLQAGNKIDQSLGE